MVVRKICIMNVQSSVRRNIKGLYSFLSKVIWEEWFTTRCLDSSKTINTFVAALRLIATMLSILSLRILCPFHIYAWCHFYIVAAGSVVLYRGKSLFNDIRIEELVNCYRHIKNNIIIILHISWFPCFSVWRSGLNREHIRTTFACYIIYGSSNHIQLCFYVLSVRYV